MPDELVSRCALESHLALVGGCVEGGVKDALIKLIRLTYLSFFLWEAGYNGEPSDFLEAERALDTAVNRAAESGLWQLNEDECAVVKRVVCEHDEQLHAVSMRAYLEATKRLELLLRRPQTRSPIQEHFRGETAPART